MIHLARAGRSRHVKLIILAAVIVVCLSAGLAALYHRADAARFSTRGLYINSAKAGDTTWYELTLAYTTPSPVGSLRLEFCDNPIPDFPCEVPPGLNVSGAALGAQTGQTGFALSYQDDNLLVLSRTPSVTSGGLSTYRFDNMVNPSGDDQDFYIRITSHASTDATGPYIDFGSVSNTTVRGTDIYTQVPPILTFCVGKTVSLDCELVDDNLVDFGELQPGEETYVTTSEMAARTNGRYGYNIYVTGTSFTSGIRQIPALTVPTESFVGVGQFGFNLVMNSDPTGIGANVGADPAGPATNVTLNGDYVISDHYVFRDGDLLASSNYVTPPKKYTSTYVLNIPEDQPAGHYSTTITYICLAGF